MKVKVSVFLCVFTVVGASSAHAFWSQPVEIESVKTFWNGWNHILKITTKTPIIKENGAAYVACAYSGGGRVIANYSPSNHNSNFMQWWSAAVQARTLQTRVKIWVRDLCNTEGYTLEGIDVIE